MISFLLLREYLPYAVGIARWATFLLLKVIPAIFYSPYTSHTLLKDAKRHDLLMRRGWILCLRTGSRSGLVGGLLGFALAHLYWWLKDRSTYHERDTGERIVTSLGKGFLPGFFVLFSFAAIIEGVNIRLRRKFMNDLRAHQTDGFSDDLTESITMAPMDVTVVIPVYNPPPAFKANLASLIVNNPAKIYVVADITCMDKIQAIVNTLECRDDMVTVIPEPKPGKRAALSTGLRAVRTRLTCFVDDDCQWCDDDFLPQLIMPFNNRTIGGVGSKQIMRPSEEYPKKEDGEAIVRKAKILEIMADFRLSVRYIDLMATTAIDRGASCISGRTMCFRTDAIADEDFHEAFLNETLMGVHLLSGDDKFLTRYIIKKGYKTYHQLQKGCVLTTTFESSRQKHMSQLIRWSRNTWRSDITALFVERKIVLHNPFTAFLLFDKLFTPFFLLYGLMLIPVYTLMRMDWVLLVAWIAWLHISRALKLMLHFKREPGHLLYLSTWIAYQYLLGCVRVYALFTMLRTHWGNRAVVVKGNQVVRTGEFADLKAEQADVEQALLPSLLNVEQAVVAVKGNGVERTGEFAGIKAEQADDEQASFSSPLDAEQAVVVQGNQVDRTGESSDLKPEHADNEQASNASSMDLEQVISLLAFHAVVA